MPPPVLLDYEFQFSDNGLLINATTPGNSVWDVEKITGLQDIPAIGAIVSEADGQHGGYIHAAFTGPRFVAFEGTFYKLGGAHDIATRFNLMKEDLMLHLNTPTPLYVKYPGQAQQYLNAKFMAFRGDTDRAARTGQAPFFIQFGCEDPLLYIDNADAVLTSGVNHGLVNTGTASTGFEVYFDGELTSGLQRVRDMSNNLEVSFNAAGIGGDQIILDMRKRRLLKNGIDVSGSIVTAEWFLNNRGGAAQNLRVDKVGGAATITLKSRSGWW